MIPGLYELIVLIAVLSIPPVIYYDARRKGKNPYFWSFAVLIGLLLNYFVGLLLVAVYFIHRDNNPNSAVALKDEFLNLFDLNERKVLECLLNHGEMNQSEIVARTKLSHATVSRILKNLESRNIVVRHRNGMQKVVRLSDDIKCFGSDRRKSS